MRRLENREINDLHAQAERGGLGQATALVDCVAEGPDQLMFMEGDTLVVLRDLGDELLAFCEGEVGWVKRENISFDNLASTSSAPSSPKSSTCLATPSDLSISTGLVPQTLLPEDYDFANGTTAPLAPKAKPPVTANASQSPKLDSSADDTDPPLAALLDQAAPAEPTPEAASEDATPPASEAQNSSNPHSRTASDASSGTGSTTSYIGPLVIGGLGPRLQHAQDASDHIDDDPSTHTFGRFTGLGAYSAQSPFRSGANAPVQTVAGRVGVSTISPTQRQSVAVEASRLSQLRFSDLNMDGSVLHGVLQEDEDEAEEQLQDPLPGRTSSKPDPINVRTGLPATITEEAETPRASESPKPLPPQALFALPPKADSEDATLTTPTSATKDSLSLPTRLPFEQPQLTPKPGQAEVVRPQIDPSVTGLPVSDSPKSATAFSFRLAYDDPDTDSESATKVAPPSIKATSPLATAAGASLLTPLEIPEHPIHPGLATSPSILDSSSSLQSGSPDLRDAATKQFYGLGHTPHVPNVPVASSPLSAPTTPPSAYLQQQAPWQNDLNRHANRSQHAAKESQSDHGSVQSVHHVPLGKGGEPVARGHRHSSSTTSSPPRQGKGPLHPPISYRDFADPTVSADGIEFEIVQPRKASNGPPAIRLSLESASLGILSGSERESLESGSHGQSFETDEWGFLKRCTPTPAIFQSRVPPSEVRAAEQKWLDIITRPLPHGQQASKKVRRMVIEQGIPASLRGKVWGWLMSNGQSGRVDFLFQRLLTNEATVFDEQIVRDASQVYKDHSAFVGPNSTGQQDLRTLLRAFMNFAPDGYRTEIAQIGGALLVHAVVEDAFWLMAGLFNGVLKTYYVKDRGAFSVDLHVFAGILQGSEPKIAKLFRDLGIAPHHYLEQWWTALFIRSLPWPTVLRFLDAVISEGPRYILIGSLSVLTLSRERLLALPKTPQAVLGYLRNLPQDSLLLPDTFMRACEEVKLRDDDLKKLRSSVKEQLALSGGH
ncbi:hypothetical protein Q8F55_002327 [Vanrija albida]|uniref:Rab-GAP TBC domain-containing protein n=1 Tax=Vanrija albida TaxID=181172 RepID=A0ABR3Q9F2_9TREE